MQAQHGILTVELEASIQSLTNMCQARAREQALVLLERQEQMQDFSQLSIDGVSTAEHSWTLDSSVIQQQLNSGVCQ